MPPPWAWRRTLFPLDENLQVEGVWGLEDRPVALASHFDSSYIPWFEGGDSWWMSPAPSAIEIFRAGAVIDDRLWFLGYVSGLGPREVSLRLVGTDGDENSSWKAFPPSDLDPDVVPRSLGKIRDTWVVAYLGEGGNIEIGAPQFLETSTDGVRWSPARVPSLRGVDPFDVGFREGGGTLDFVVVPTSITRSGATEIVFLRSPDGVTWREVRPPEELDWSFDLACNDRACVLTPYADEDTPLPYPVPIAWVSTNGVTWTPSATTLGEASAGSGLAFVAATSEGFVGIEGGHSTAAWASSPDGLTWRRFEVLPADLKVPIVDFAVGGGFAVALEQGPDVERQGAWVGSLAALGIGN